MSKRILILGASVLQLPAIKAAKRKGFVVGVADQNINAIGMEFADVRYCVSTIDIDGILRVATEFRADGVMTLATDMPVRAVAKCASQLALPGISVEAAEKATDKAEMIRCFADHSVASPWFYVIENKADLYASIDQISYPCILKPVDNAGSRGVILVNHRDELETAYTYSKKESRSGVVIIEEYLKGHEVSVETMTEQGETHVLAITDKLTTGAPHFVEMGHSQPTILPLDVQERVERLAVDAVDSLGINIGPAHVEIMVTENGPKVIELGARLGGDCITTHLVPLSTGIDMVGATIDLLTGREPDLKPIYSFGSAIRYIGVDGGRIKSVEGVDEAKHIPGIKEIVLTKGIGDTVKTISSSTDRVGFVIAQATDVRNAIRICEDAMRKIRVITE
jgi:biotin carboxylase